MSHFTPYFEYNDAGWTQLSTQEQIIKSNQITSGINAAGFTNVLKQNEEQYKENVKLQNQHHNENLAVANELVNNVNEGNFLLQEQSNILENGLGNIVNTLEGVQKSFDLNITRLLEQLYIVHTDLEDIKVLLNIPEFEKEKVYYLNQGLKFLKEAISHPKRNEDALACFLEAEKRNGRDYLILHQIGLQYLYSDGLIDLEKAEGYLMKSADYAASTQLGNDDHITSSNSGEVLSLYHLAYCQLLSSKFTECLKTCNKALEINGGLTELKIIKAECLIFLNQRMDVFPILENLLLEHTSEYLKLKEHKNFVNNEKIQSLFNYVIQEVIKKGVNLLRETKSFLNVNSPLIADDKVSDFENSLAEVKEEYQLAKLLMDIESYYFLVKEDHECYQSILEYESEIYTFDFAKELPFLKSHLKFIWDNYKDKDYSFTLGQIKKDIGTLIWMEELNLNNENDCLEYEMSKEELLNGVNMTSYKYELSTKDYFLSTPYYKLSNRKAYVNVNFISYESNHHDEENFMTGTESIVNYLNKINDSKAYLKKNINVIPKRYKFFEDTVYDIDLILAFTKRGYWNHAAFILTQYLALWKKDINFNKDLKKQKKQLNMVRSVMVISLMIPTFMGWIDRLGLAVLLSILALLISYAITRVKTILEPYHEEFGAVGLSHIALTILLLVHSVFSVPNMIWVFMIPCIILMYLIPRYDKID